MYVFVAVMGFFLGALILGSIGFQAVLFYEDLQIRGWKEGESLFVFLVMGGEVIFFGGTWWVVIMKILLRECTESSPT